MIVSKTNIYFFLREEVSRKNLAKTQLKTSFFLLKSSVLLNDKPLGTEPMASKDINVSGL